MRTQRLLVLMATLSLASPAIAGAQDVVVVLPFQNAGSYTRGDAGVANLEQSLAQGLARELSARTGARPVPAGEVKQALSGVNLGQEGRVDAASAARVGKSLGARYVIAGTWLDHFGKVRVDARVVDVQTGKVTGTASAGPADRSELQLLLRRLAEQLPMGAG